MQHTVPQVMCRLWMTMQAKRIQPSDGAWRWTGICERQTRWLRIFTYDLITSVGVGQRKTSGNGKETSNSRPDPHEMHTATVSDLEPLQHS